jgi:hypothetical protein
MLGADFPRHLIVRFSIEYDQSTSVFRREFERHESTGALAN